MAKWGKKSEGKKAKARPLEAQKSLDGKNQTKKVAHAPSDHGVMANDKSLPKRILATSPTMIFISSRAKNYLRSSMKKS